MDHPKNSMINHIHKKVSPIVPVMLMIKYYSIKYTAFYFFMFIVKFIPALIISSNFNLYSIASNSSITLLRFFTAHSIVSPGISFTQYIIGCIVIMIIQCINIGHFIWYCYRFAKRSKPIDPKLSKLFIVLIHIHILIAQIEIEYLSFPYYVLGFSKSFPIKNSVSQSVIILFAVINTIFIIVINAENFIIFQSINTPFNQNTYPVKIKFSVQRILLVLFMENITILESFELYANGIVLKSYKITIFIVFCVCLVITAILSLNEYNFKNNMNDLLAFLSAFIFTSVMIEVIIYLTGTTISNELYLVFVSAWKIVIPVLIVYIMKLINQKHLRDSSQSVLFKVYEYKIEGNDLDPFLHILDLLSELRSGSIESQELLSILYQHKKECFNEKCKCQLIQLFSFQDNKCKDEYIKLLISRIGFLIETSFVQIDYSNDYSVSILLAEYFFDFRQNSIMAYSIIQTYFYSNLRKMSLDQIITIYSISQKYIMKCKELISHETFNYSEYHTRFRQAREIYKKMILLCENFKIITNAKSSFENSIKIHRDFNSGEIMKIISSFLTSICLNSIIETMSVLTMTYKTIISRIVEWSSNLMTIEYYYKIYLFFNIMNTGKLPKEIKGPVYKFITQHLNINSNSNSNSKLLSIDLTSILYQLYESKKYTYNIIMKFCRGFQIVFFSEKLANDLGFVYSSLIGEDFNVIFPKKFREIHQKAMVDFLITKEHYSFIHSSYIFTSKGHCIPCLITISSIPGIAKNMTIICNIKILPHENKYSFILNDKYDCISVSETFDSKYALSLKLVNDFDINLLEVFNIQSNLLEQTFSNQLKKLDQFKRSIEVSTVLQFSHILHSNYSHCNHLDNDLQTNRFKVFGLQKEVKMKEDDFMKSKLDIEQLYSNHPAKKQKTNSLVLKRCKSEIVQNLINLINKFNEMEVYDERYKKLNESLYKFKHSMKKDIFYKTSIKETFDFIEAIASNNYFDSAYYYLKINLKEVFDQPLFIVNISEIIGSPPKHTSAKKISVSRSPLINLSNRMKPNTNSNSKFTEEKSEIKQIGAVQFNVIGSPVSSEKQKRNPKSSLSFEKRTPPPIQNQKTKNPLLPKPIETTKEKTAGVLSTKRKIKKLLIGLTNLYRSENINTSMIKIEIERISNVKSTFLIIGLFICLILSLGLALALLLYQKEVLNIYHLLFKNNHYILFQRDKLLNIYCLSLGILYKVSTITTINHAIATEKDIKPYHSALIEDAQVLDDLYHNFYYVYLSYKDKKSESYDEMLIQNDYQQIKLNWKPLMYSSDFFTEIQYLSILYNKVIISNDDLIGISQDANQFLFNSFFKYPNREVESDYGRLMFYFGANYLLSYERFIEWFVEQMNNEIKVHHDNSTVFYIIIELMIIIVYIVFFAFVFYYLVKHNNIIFKSIVKMFVFTSPGEKYTFKNQYSNYSLFQKVNDLINVTNNFNIDNLSFVLLTNKLKKHYNKLNLTQMTSNIHNNTETGFTPFFSNSASSKSIATFGFKKLVSSHTINAVKIKRQHSGNVQKKSSNNAGNNSTINENNSTLLSSMNNTHSRILTRKQTKENLIDEINEKSLTKTLVLDYTVNSGIQVIKWLKLASSALFLIFVIYFFINTILFLGMVKQIQLLFTDFYGFINYYSLAYLYFNELRIKLISPYNTIANELFDNMKDLFAEVNTDITNFINNRITTFSETNMLFYQLNRNTTDGTREDLAFLCNNNTQCMGIIVRNQNDIISKGINLAVNSIFLQLTNLYVDFVNLKEGSLQTVNDVKQFLEGSQLDNIEETLTFVLNNVKEVMYLCLFNDEDKIMKDIYFKVSIFNYLSFCYCALVFILIMFGIILNVQRHIKPIVYGAYKLNRMFYYNYLEDTKDVD